MTRGCLAAGAVGLWIGLAPGCGDATVAETASGPPFPSGYEGSCGRDEFVPGTFRVAGSSYVELIGARAVVDDARLTVVYDDLEGLPRRAVWIIEGSTWSF